MPTYEVYWTEWATYRAVINADSAEEAEERGVSSYGEYTDGGIEENSVKVVPYVEKEEE